MSERTSNSEASKVERFDYGLESDRRFLQRIAQARASLRAGRGVRLQDIEKG